MADAAPGASGGRELAVAAASAANGCSAAAPLRLLDVPYDFQDPISHELMWDPVLLVETGHTYNRESIQKWFQRGNRTCPKTNRKLKSLLVATNWTLRSLIESWAARHGIPVPAAAVCPSTAAPKLLRAPGEGDAGGGGGAPTALIAPGSPMEEDGATMIVAAGRPASDDGEEGVSVPESWTFFQGFDSPGGDLFRLHFDPHSQAGPLSQLLEAADKVPNCIAFHSSGHLKAALQPRALWTLRDDDDAAAGAHTCAAAAAAAAQPHAAAAHAHAAVAADASSSGFAHPNLLVVDMPEGQYGLYVRTQCLPFVEAGCSSWAADAAAAPTPPDTSGWTFFPGMDSPGGDICQAITQDSHAGQTPPALTSVDGSITSSSAIALLAMAKPLVVAFNSNGWLKKVLQPMHGWVKWTTEAGKGLFVRNDVLMALLSGVLAHVQGNQLAPVQLAGWTFIQGVDSLGGDVHWAWQHANNPVKLAEEACQIDAVIAFNTNGYIKTALRPRLQWTKVDVWADKPSSGIYVHNSVLWKLLVT